MALISSKTQALLYAIRKFVYDPKTTALLTEETATVDALLSQVIADTLVAKAGTTYANDAAAATGGVPIGGYYVTTTTGVVHARLT